MITHYAKPAKKLAEHEYIVPNDDTYVLNVARPSDWSCQLFGCDDFVFTPKLGNEPNWFWRLMQRICFGNRWVKKK